MRRTVAVAVLFAVLLPVGVAAAAPAAPGDRHRGRDLPDTIPLPEGFLGEGVAVGEGNMFYAGSRADGRVARGDLRKGTSEVWVGEPAVPMAIGLGEDVRHGLLWVAGGSTGQAAVYDLTSGETVAALTLTTAMPSFINDVDVTRDAAYFTNSRAAEIFRVPVSR